MQLTAVLMHADEGGFVALNPETGTTTQGETVDEAVDDPNIMMHIYQGLCFRESAEK